MARAKLTDAEIAAQLRRARQRKAPYEVQATRARYLPRVRAIEVTLPSGAAVTVPVSLLPALTNVGEDVLAEVHVSPGGWGVCWDEVDVQYEVGGILAVAGWPHPAAAMRELGRIGGRTKSPARARASRANGAKGGRPRKRQPA
jgi:Protein of unknown function (DUF2442)